MSRGSDYSYILMNNPHNIIYMQDWERDELPFDAIEVSERYLNEVKTDVDLGHDLSGDSNLESTAFGSSMNANQRRSKDFVWKDLDLKRFLADNHTSVLGRGVTKLEEGGEEDIMREETSDARAGFFVFGGNDIQRDRTILNTVLRRSSDSIDTAGNEFGFNGTDSGMLEIDSPNSTATTTSSISRGADRLRVD